MEDSSNQNNKRVLFLLHGSSLFDGSSKSFLIMLEGLIEQGIMPLVVVPRHGILCDKLDQIKIRNEVVPYVLSIFPKYGTIKGLILLMPKILRIIIENNLAEKKIEKLATSFKPDIIHTNVGPLHVGHNVAKRLGIPHVWHIREYQDKDFNMKPFLSKKSFIRKLKSPNNYIITITQDLYKYFSLTSNARVIYNPIYNEGEKGINFNKDPNFLFVGRLEENKGIKALIYAFSEFAKINSKYQLIIAGDSFNDSYKKSLVKLVEELDLKNNVRFLGFVNDVNELMRRATAIVVPSKYEAFGRITVEAMFNGCLVIGKNTGGTKEILEKDNLGILYNNKAELVSVMFNVCTNGIEKYFPLIRKAQSHAIKNFSKEKHISEVYSYYKEILGVN